mmetsp:Transcript_5232/g.11174  ORF Transcript_5232/g.11174 Transcript_5232/m.11174 type:complete len:276 (-) Transcript_5232:102-929(-)
MTTSEPLRSKLVLTVIADDPTSHKSFSRTSNRGSQLPSYLIPHSFANPTAHPFALVRVVDATLPPELPTMCKSYREAIWERLVPPEPVTGMYTSGEDAALKEDAWRTIGSDDMEMMADMLLLLSLLRRCSIRSANFSSKYFTRRLISERCPRATLVMWRTPPSFSFPSPPMSWNPTAYKVAIGPRSTFTSSPSFRGIQSAFLTESNPDPSWSDTKMALPRPRLRFDRSFLFSLASSQFASRIRNNSRWTVASTSMGSVCPSVAVPPPDDPTKATE